ncbi:hypothetical protein ACEPAH_7399 [Sanghuangporus vaninii]
MISKVMGIVVDANGKFKTNHFEPACYSLEVIRVEGVHSKLKKCKLFAEIEFDKTIHRTGEISNDGKPASATTVAFSQSGSRSVFNISVKQSRENSQDRLLGYASIEEDIEKLLNESLPYELKCDLTGTARSVFLRKRTVTIGSIRLCIDVVDALTRAELYVGMAERRVEKIRATTDKMVSADSVIGPVVQAVDQIIEIVDTVAQIHPVFDLSWKATSALYKLVSHQFKTDTKLVDMVDKMTEAFHFSTEALSLVDRTEMLKPTIKDLLDETARCSRAVQKYASHGFIGRIAHWPDGQTVEEYATRFDDLRRKLFSVTDVNTAKGVDNIESRQMLQMLQLQLEVSSMDISKVSTRPRCLEGTRQDYLEQIQSKLLVDTDTDQSIVWLTGVAGSGKSTIALTFSDICNDKGSPAAYLFFERGKDEYISTVRAIAYRLAVLHPSICPHIVNAVKDNSNVAGSPLKTQFEKLLLQPLQAATREAKRPLPLLIILDALDECGTSKQRQELVRLLTTDFKRLPPDVRILVTSRPENDILKHLTPKGHIHRIELEHTSQRDRRDVDTYIKEMMIATVERGPPKGWEWEGICEILSDAADGLFIWASTAVKIVGDSNNPRRKLRTLLDDIKSVGGGIDSLYVTVLEQSGISWHEAEATDEFSRILGFILFAKENLSGEDIEAFLGLEEDTADTVLGRLRSVVSFEHGQPVRFHHASFADYLTSERSSGKPWNINESVQRLAIAERCFEVMIAKLRFNICGIETSFLNNDKIPGLQDHIQKEIPLHLVYACRFWAIHLCELSCPDSLMTKLKTFANHQLLYWFEVLSLTKHYNRIAGQALLNSSIKTAPIDTELSSFLWAAYRLAVTFALPISQSAPHIYLSAISLLDGESRVANHYSKSQPIVKVYRYGKKLPAQCIKILQSSSWVASVVFSSDGRRIASGSNDSTVQVWDPDSGEVVSGPFEGRLVTFSPDGKRVASSSYDCTVRVWDVESGELVLGPLEHRGDLVHSIVFSPDGKHIACCSQGNAIYVWDAGSGKLVGDLFKGYRIEFTSAAFSPDGTHIALGSWDAGIRIWDTKNGKFVVGPFKGHRSEVLSIAFSPDGRRIVSGSKDRSIRVWDVSSGEQVTRPMEGHTGYVISVSFSPEGKRIVSGSEDKTICVWNADLGELVAGPFIGHTSSVLSVAFSPDGKRVVSGSQDKTIRIWDAESGKVASHELQARPDPVNSVSFSPDGERIASGSSNRGIRIWDAKSGELILGDFGDYSDSAQSLAFSPDGRRIASNYGYNFVGIWDAGNGELTASLERHRREVWSITFSPDGRFVASGSGDKTICIWDTSSGILVVGPLRGHADGVNSVAFSADGRFIASGSDDRTIRIWNASSGESVSGPFMGHTGRIGSVAYSPDGKHIASGSADNTVRVWDANSGELFSGPFEWHTDQVTSVAFSPNGKHIASSSNDKTICISAVDNGQLILGPLEGHADIVLSVAFAPDGKAIASGSEDGTVRVWDVHRADLKASSSDFKHANVTSLDRSSRVAKDGVISAWTMSDDGWILGSKGELLTWIPEDMRSVLWRPRNTAVFGQGFSVRLDLSNSPLGEDWCKGFPLSGASTAR